MFSILFFSDGVRPWRNELVQADHENKLAAKAFVRRLKCGNKTNTYGALNSSLNFDEQLEAIFLLTDGEPTTGTIVRRDAIVNAITKQNRWHYLTINTIGISVEGSTESFLRALAKGTGGEFRFPR